jgi:hypothetical protein
MQAIVPKIPSNIWAEITHDSVMVYAMIAEVVYELCELDCEPLSRWLTISILLEPSDVADICSM